MHQFESRTTWTGALDGQGQLITSSTELMFSAPAALGGKGVGTNPEELLLGAAATCFLITLSAVLNRMQVPQQVLRVRSELEVSTEGGLTVRTLTHYPNVDAESPKVAKALEIAELNCLVAKAMKGNVVVRVIPSKPLI